MATALAALQLGVVLRPRPTGHDTTWTPSRSHHELSCAALTSPSSSSSSDPSSLELQLCRRCMAFALLAVSTPNLADPQHRSSLPSPVLTETTSRLPFFGTRLLLPPLQHPHAPPQPRQRTARAAGGHSLAVPCAWHQPAPGRVQLAAGQPQLVVAGHWPAASQQPAKQAAAGRGKSGMCCNNPAPPRSSLEPRRRRSRRRQALAFPFLSLILDLILDT